MVWVVGLLVSVGLALVADGEVDGAAVAFATGAIAACMLLTFYELVRRPSRITVTDVGLVFEFRTKNLLIPWDQLVSVRRRIDRRGAFLVWRHRNTSRVLTLYHIVDRAELRAIVEHHAPDAELRGL
ncbi:MAG TPA: hypothetical protein VGO78_13670 [Acidimicrobiales bacterium]|nr:hypothetical protein [Acidimicrobiales bacterium]